MDLHEWAEDVTSGIESNRKAREVRRELLGHLASIADELIAEGLDPKQAATEAVSRMGSSEQLQGSLRQVTGSLLSRGQMIGLAIGAAMALLGALGSLGSIVFSNLFVAPVLLGVIVMAGAASSPGEWRTPFSALGRGLKRNFSVIIAWAVLGLVAGSQPFWFQGPQTPWYLPSWVWPLALAVSIAAVVWTTIRAFSKGGALTSLGALEAGLLAYTGLSSAIGLALWRIWPSPASPYAWWYAIPGVRLPWYEGPLVTHLATSIGAQTLSGVALLGLVWAVRTGVAALKRRAVTDAIKLAGTDGGSPARREASILRTST